MIFKFCREFSALLCLAKLTQTVASEVGSVELPLVLFTLAWAWCLRETFLEVVESLTGKVLLWELLKKKSPTAALEFWVILFTDTMTAEAILGDIEERLPLIESQLGTSGAQEWLKAQVRDSVFRLVWGAILRFVGFTALRRKFENFRP